VKHFDLDTPALAVDLNRMEANLRRMADYAREHELRVRPHTKTHKSPLLGRKQLDLGAVGLTVAKPTEAEVMLAAGSTDLLIAFPTIGAAKMERLKNLAQKVQLTVALDSYEAAQALSEAGVRARVLVEMDGGLHRVGVAPEDLLPLVERIRRLPNIEYDGISFYPGHIKEMGEEGMGKIEVLNALVSSKVDELRRAGHEPRLVSGGSTPTMWHSHRIEAMNEIRPGTYIFNDRNTIRSGACSLEDCAATVIVTVISTAYPGQVLVDGGSKTFSSDRLLNDPNLTFGKVLNAPGAVFHKMNEEHGFIDVTKCDRGFRVGDKLEILMNHVCVVMNLHEQAWGHRNGEVEISWAITGRGKLN
jgi:D-serine deaminase-like pyridoxal phosphate-dependent protein